MLNSVSSGDVTTSTLLAENDDNNDEHAIFLPTYIIFGCFILMAITFIIYTFVA